MALKKATKVTKNNDEQLKQQLREGISNTEEAIEKLQAKKTDMERELLELEIKPFKIGDYALAKVPSGKTMKEQKCLLECEHGTLYVRPVKADGELSGRHFILTPWGKYTYADCLKEVK